MAIAERKPVRPHLAQIDTSLRRQIDTLRMWQDPVKKDGDRAVGKLPGFQLIPESTRYPQGDCFSYAFGIENNFKRLADAVVDTIQNGTEIDTPDAQVGDLVFYMKKGENLVDGDDVTHVARIVGIENGTIFCESRWGLAKGGQTQPVFRHPIDGIPTSYGEKLTILRRPPRRS